MKEANYSPFIVNGSSNTNITAEPVSDGEILYHIRCRFNQTLEEKESLVIGWEIPVCDITGVWYPTCQTNRALKVHGSETFVTRFSASAPVITFYNACGINRYTVCLSEVIHPVEFKTGIREEDGNLLIQLSLDSSLFEQYELKIRIDRREVPFYEALERAVQWWEISGLTPCPVPESAWKPVYSTWYAWHQDVCSEVLEQECKIAKNLGMDTIILDDGWQTADNHRGYAFCGDWKIEKSKFPDFKQHVHTIHELGMKYMMWFSVPFVGVSSRAWQRFQDKLLYYDADQKAGVLDPRYPQTREYLIDTYEFYVREYAIDGLKLDFINEFYSRKEPAAISEGMDYQNVQEAVERLLQDIATRLRQIKPDIMLEFRQPYCGPAMRKYGNFFRGTDCPYSELLNRIETIDLRLLSGGSAVHSDMLMWHREETAEAAARQIIGSIFSVIQFSVVLRDIDVRKRKMLSWWLQFIKENEEILLRGKLVPVEPQNLYPEVRAFCGNKSIIALYSCNRAIELQPEWNWTAVLNGMNTTTVCLSSAICGNYQIIARDCCGDEINRWETRLNHTQALRIPVAAGGGIEIRKKL